MSVAAMAWAMDQNVPPTPSHVLLVLANYADPEGVCWPAIGTIKSKTRLSERAIRDALRVLEEEGAIVRLSAGTGGRATSTRYQLQVGNPAANAGYSRKTRQQAPGNGLDTRQEAPGKPSQKQQYPATGAVNPAAAAPDPSRTTKKEEGVSGRDLPEAPARTLIPEDYQPSAKGEALAMRLGLDVLRTLIKFRGWYRSKAVLSADWNGQWDVWCVGERERMDRDAASKPAVYRNGMIAVAVELRQARQAAEEPQIVPNQFLIAPGSGRRDN